MSARGTTRAALERDIERLSKELTEARVGERLLGDYCREIAGENEELIGALDELRQVTLDYTEASARLTIAQEDSWDVLYNGASEREVVEREKDA